MSIDVFLELDADLALRRLILDERMFQQLLSAWSHCVVFDQTHLDKIVKLLRPVTSAQYNNCSPLGRPDTASCGTVLPDPLKDTALSLSCFQNHLNPLMPTIAIRVQL